MPKRASLLFALALGMPVLGACAGWAAPPPAEAGADASAAAPALVAEVAAGGLRQRVLVLSPAAPRATLVMLPGGSGAVGLSPEGRFAHGAGILIRTRDRFRDAGYAVIIPDAPAGISLRGRRSTPAYAAVVRALVGLAREHSDAPVFLVGTSQGAIAAMNGAAQLTGGEIAGLVLLEAVSRRGGSGETVFDAAPEQVSVPVLVVANPDDACFVAPPADAPRIAAALSAAPRVEVRAVAGGISKGPPCGSRSPHGYLGIEPAVVDAITGFIASLPGADRAR